MAHSIDGNSNQFNILTQQLQKKQQMLASLQAQKEAVMAKLEQSQDKVTYQEGVNSTTKEQLADYVVALSNLKEPNKVDDPGKEPVQGDYQKDVQQDGATVKVDDVESFDAAHSEWKTKNDAYQQYLKDMEAFQNQKSALEEKIQEFSAIESENEQFLADLVQIASDAEQEVVQNQQGIDVNTGDIEALNAEIAQMKNFSFDVNDGDRGFYDSVKNQFAQMQQAGLVPADAQATDYTKDELKALGKKIVELDKANGTGGVATDSKGLDKYYTRMRAGESYGDYSFAQLNDMLETSGVGSINVSDQSFGSFSMSDLEAMGNEYAEHKPVSTTSSEIKPEQEPQPQAQPETKPQTEKPVGNEKYKTGRNGEITLPRGVQYHDATGNSVDQSLELHGIKDNGDGTYTNSAGKNLTADEVNDYFRSIEKNTDRKFSHYLDQAEDLGIDIDDALKNAGNGESSVKALKQAIDTQKALNKYSDEIKQYGINTEGMSAEDIKDAVKDAKKGPKPTNNNEASEAVPKSPVKVPDKAVEETPASSQEVKADETVETPVTPDVSETSTAPTTPEVSETPETSETPVASKMPEVSGNLSQADIESKVSELKPGETFRYTQTTSSSSATGSYSHRTTISWTRGEDGKLTCTYYDTNQDLVNEIYDETGKQKLTEIRKKPNTRSYMSGDMFRNRTTNYGEDGTITDRSIDLTNMKNNHGSLPTLELYRFLEKNKPHYSTQTVRNDSGKSILTLKNGEYYNSKGKQIDEDKAFEILRKAYEKGQITDLNQIK